MVATLGKVAAVVLGLVICLGCVSVGGNTIISHLYYYYGPEDTLETLETSDINPENLALADLEKAVVLLELGRFEESLDALKSAEFRLDAARVTTTLGVARSGYQPWRPEYHERVLASTLAMANSLALYDTVGAANAADRALSRIAEFDCGECVFDFTRLLAALAYGGAGRFEDGVAVLSGMDVEGPGLGLVNGIRRRLERGVAGFQTEGLAPPPGESERFVVAVLLFGGGPYKVATKLDLNPTRTIKWYRYQPREEQTVGWASADVEEPVISAELTDLNALAATALDLRTRRVVAGEETPLNPDKHDLRHWTTLPASLQVLAIELEPATDIVDLVYHSPDGYEIDREPIEVPGAWLGGPIFVVRRVP